MNKIMKSSLYMTLCLVLIECCFGQLTDKSVKEIKKTVDKKFCSDQNYSDEVIAKLEECEKFDPHYKMDQLYKQCQQSVPKGELSWNERRKLNCKIKECFNEKMGSNKQLVDEIHNLDPIDVEKRQIQKFECLAKAL